MDFEFVAGDVALDFVATISEWTTTHRERLTSPREFADWLVRAEVFDVAPKVSAADLQAAKLLREQLYEFVVCVTANRPVPRKCQRVINQFAAVAPPVVLLDAAGEPRTTGSVAAALSYLARAAISLADARRRALIAWCADPTCTRAFVDQSRGGRRRWCGMSGCGDRAKAAAYRSRRGH